MEVKLFVKLVMSIMDPANEQLTPEELVYVQESGLLETLELFFQLIEDPSNSFEECVSAMRVALHIPETENTGRHET
ncbi:MULTISPECIES: hypothetical protein [Anaerotruncus]|uniref:hypothetical protein n=1 Tax=Anaerotruncus TaxID=244127 RepID=UPI00082E7B8A|nr:MULTISPECIES: hypothetical protein [Anaerotruncus]RGX56928.1 hypothetical protein DWV16_01015 [Anaerotruncus sp. AF02-27]